MGPHRRLGSGAELLARADDVERTNDIPGDEPQEFEAGVPQSAAADEGT